MHSTISNFETSDYNHKVLQPIIMHLFAIRQTPEGILPIPFTNSQ